MSSDAFRFSEDERAWRNPGSVVALCRDLGECDPALLDASVHGPWWQILADAGVTLLVTREYEHLLIALSAVSGAPLLSYLRLPHPSGVAFDAINNQVHVASTRNPNAVYMFRPATGLLDRHDLAGTRATGRPLMPTSARFLPGSTYLHDLAIIDGRLHANAVGENAVIAFDNHGDYRRVWWPACIERSTGPDFGLNHIQLNGIATGSSVAESFFTASKASLDGTRPGEPDFVAKGAGVVFNGKSRQPATFGLTRPHSPRFVGDALWVANSGFGEIVCCDSSGGFETVAKLPGWTRGLCNLGKFAIVGTSRIIPRFHHYAPGLQPEDCVCGLHAIDVATGRIEASLIWPTGNQIFAIEAIPSSVADRLPFDFSRSDDTRALFYAWQASGTQDIGGEE